MIEAWSVPKEEQTDLEKLIIASFNQIIVNIESDEDKLKEISKKIKDICKTDVYYESRLIKTMEKLITDSISMQIGILLNTIDDYHNTFDYVEKMSENESIRILHFFKQEIPDVYSNLKKEFNKRRKT